MTAAFVTAVGALAAFWVVSTAHGQATPTAHGRALLEQKCSACHAIGTSGSSLHEKAPAFRDLSKRYPIENLQEALVEGLSSGHPDMPEFEFTPREAGAIISYLESIQTSAK